METLFDGVVSINHARLWYGQVAFSGPIPGAIMFPGKVAITQEGSESFFGKVSLSVRCKDGEVCTPPGPESYVELFEGEITIKGLYEEGWAGTIGIRARKYFMTRGVMSIE